jgi:hypothetical protein
MDNSRKPDNHRGLASRGSNEISTSERRYNMRHFKEPFCTSTSSMNTFWDSLPVKIKKFLHQMIVLKQNWTVKRQGLFLILFFLYSIHKLTWSQWITSKINEKVLNPIQPKGLELPPSKLKKSLGLSTMNKKWWRTPQSRTNFYLLNQQ